MENRIIKFRAWNPRTKQMVISDLANGDTQFEKLGLFFMGTQIGDSRYDIVYMQFTGLLDKNGKEIYEGDVIHYIDNPTGICTGNYEVIFDAGFIGIESHLSLHLTDLEPHMWVEVIGNIYTNPELLTA